MHLNENIEHDPNNDMTIDKLISSWSKDPYVQDTMVIRKNLPSRYPKIQPFPDDIHPDVLIKIHRNQIKFFYTHQLAAWRKIQNRQHIVLTTGTASGKSLVYNLAVINNQVINKYATALYLFPTKALAQDQHDHLHPLIPAELYPHIKSGLYDGDTKQQLRPGIRKNASIIFTNPDMLHFGILPHHTQWSKLFSGLRYVIIDEVHSYRGVFGSHVSNIFRRLKRIAHFYGSSPLFIFTSATIGNPSAHCSSMIGENVIAIAEDGSPNNEKEFIIINPPVINQELGLRRGIYQETIQITKDLNNYDLQTLVFARSRSGVEILLRNLQQTFPESKLENSIRGYRSGYLPAKRREIEAALRNGKARIVVTTNALELGIDIGGLDVILMAGYPGLISSTWQQAGRAGRKQAQKSLIVMVLGSNPLDQFLAKHVEYLFEQNPEKALINPDHPIILFEHIKCAIYELPFDPNETFGNLRISEMEEIFNLLAQERIVYKSNEKFMWISDIFPAANISLRSASTQRIIIQTEKGVIGEVEKSSAHWMVHPDAIYLHEGDEYYVQTLDLDQNIAYVSPSRVDYFTEPRREMAVTIEQINSSAMVAGGEKAFGGLKVVSQVIGYRRIQWETYSNLGFGSVDLPPISLITDGYWIKINKNSVDSLRIDGMWLNDAINYGAEWKLVREQAKARDLYTCQVCGALESGTSHHIHHKIPFRSFVSSYEANRLENLITLCPNCHRRVEQNVRIRSGLAGIGYALVNLAPLFLMCDRSDLGLHIDPRSKLANGNPIIIIYEQIPAGIGLSSELYNLHDKLMSHTFDLINACDCIDGCPSCVGPGGENGLGGKIPSIELMRVLLD